MAQVKLLSAVGCVIRSRSLSVTEDQTSSMDSTVSAGIKTL